MSLFLLAFGREWLILGDRLDEFGEVEFFFGVGHLLPIPTGAVMRVWVPVSSISSMIVTAAATSSVVVVAAAVSIISISISIIAISSSTATSRCFTTSTSSALLLSSRSCLLQTC